MSRVSKSIKRIWTPSSSYPWPFDSLISCTISRASIVSGTIADKMLSSNSIAISTNHTERFVVVPLQLIKRAIFSERVITYDSKDWTWSILYGTWLGVQLLLFIPTLYYRDMIHIFQISKKLSLVYQCCLISFGCTVYNLPIVYREE